MEIFVAVIDSGGFTEAANRLRLSKSSVSKHIASLESRLGVTLLNRTTRNVSATEIGINYYQNCIRFLEQIQEADLSVKVMQTEAQGMLKLSASNDFGSALMRIASAVRSRLSKCATVWASSIKIGKSIPNAFASSAISPRVSWRLALIMPKRIPRLSYASRKRFNSGTRF